jgi:hypothetical protein
MNDNVPITGSNDTTEDEDFKFLTAVLSKEETRGLELGKAISRLDTRFCPIHCDHIPYLNFLTLS